MTPAEALHTAARRYCAELYAYWCDQYSRLCSQLGDREPNGYDYTPAALTTFPRYNVLRAILHDVEQLDATALGGFDETKEWLLLAGRTANDAFTAPPRGPIETRVMDEEREAYCRHITDLAPSAMPAFEPLPYRRVLRADEAKVLWTRLRARWQIPRGYWYPLASDAPAGVAAIKALDLDLAFPPDRLHSILTRRGIDRVWELREYGPEYELSVEVFEPYYTGAEGYWSSGELDWIVYASHENSVTVGGWLLGELQALWPAWREHVWTGMWDV